MIIPILKCFFGSAFFNSRRGNSACPKYSWLCGQCATLLRAYAVAHEEVEIALRDGPGGALHAALRSLRGTLQASVGDGTLKGVNVDRGVCLAQRGASQGAATTADACDEGADTRWSMLRLGGAVTRGVWRSGDVSLETVTGQGRAHRLTGAGTLDLPTGARVPAALERPADLEAPGEDAERLLAALDRAPREREARADVALPAIVEPVGRGLAGVGRCRQPRRGCRPGCVRQHHAPVSQAKSGY